jgi:hypothetical protein
MAFMTPEARTEALETEVAKLRADLATIAHVLSSEGGKQAVFHDALVALITATPPNPVLEKILADRLARTEARSVAESNMEAYLDGVQSAQEYVQSGVAESRRLYAD